MNMSKICRVRFFIRFLIRPKWPPKLEKHDFWKVFPLLWQQYIKIRKKLSSFPGHFYHTHLCQISLKSDNAKWSKCLDKRTNRQTQPTIKATKSRSNKLNQELRPLIRGPISKECTCTCTPTEMVSH